MTHCIWNRTFVSCISKQIMYGHKKPIIHCQIEALWWRVMASLISDLIWWYVFTLHMVHVMSIFMFVMGTMWLWLHGGFDVGGPLDSRSLANLLSNSDRVVMPTMATVVKIKQRSPVEERSTADLPPLNFGGVDRLCSFEHSRSTPLFYSTADLAP